MERMNLGPTLLYATLAIGAALLSWWLLLPTVDLALTNPDHQAYVLELRQHEKDLKEHDKYVNSAPVQEQLAERRFELVMAGQAGIETLGSQADRQLAEVLLALKSADPDIRTQAVSQLLQPDAIEAGGLILSHFYCYEGTCQPLGVMNVVTDGRLRSLWSSDAATIAKVMTPEPPGLAAPPPPTPPSAETSIYWVPEPVRYAVTWLTLILPAALAFMLGGLVINRISDDELPNPFTSLPNTVIGWLIILALLPGWLIIQAVHLTGRDFRPTLKRLGGWLRPRRYANEYERTIAELTRLEGSELVTRHPDLRRRIDQARNRIGETQDAAEVAKIRVMISDLEDYARSMEETDALLDTARR